MCSQSGRIGGSCVVDSMRGYLLGNANDQRAVGPGGLLLEEDNTLADAVPGRWTLAAFVTTRSGHLFMGCLYCGLKESGIRLPPIQNTDREGVASRFLHTFKLVSNLNFSREDDLEAKNKKSSKANTVATCESLTSSKLVLSTQVD